ncbi:MAG: GDP-mannose 4,6-dehydratase [Planctomycetota bacterium]|jgi:UDP-glucose 4-epimerase|nr:GDP-mannose 4,6-dehydratase [Planctomycetota bacterium]
MHYLVTGGSGFIGSHVIDRLLARGDRVTSLDDYSTGDAANLAPVTSHPQLTILHGSVCDELVVDEAASGVEAIIHLAAAVGVKRILERQVAGIMTNLRGTEVVLRAAAAHGRLPVFLASSSEVYGKGLKAPFVEDDDSLLGATSLHRWSYACAKAMDEFLALAYHRERGLPVRIGRFFNTTGPRQSAAYGMVLPRFCQAALRGEALEVHGDGAQSRCFLHVADCVSALLALLDSDDAVGQVVNIGGAEEVTIKDLAQRVIAAAGSGSVKMLSYAEAFPEGGFEDLRRRVPSVAKLQALTGWTPERDLGAIIDDCLTACRAQAAAGDS